METETLQKITLAVAAERSLEDVLKRIVEGLRDLLPGAALARIWLIEPGDICASCYMKNECPDRTRCLHLVSSSGHSRLDFNETWNRLDGAFRRFPIGVRKVGQVAATGNPALLQGSGDSTEWIAHPDWFEREGILSFAAQPLIFRGEVLGVLAVFSRQTIDLHEFGLMRTFADHAAVAIANSRALREVERLREQVELENAYLREEVKFELAFGDIVGRGPALRKVLEQIELVAPTDAGVLILGESGTGKELIARAIHERSRRRARALVKVNCGSIPRDLFESEFFGHVKGAFTGAVKDRTGRFQLADGGTLFLDEIGEVQLELQSKLLRVLQEGQFERVGEDRTRRVDVRMIAATNRDLKQEVQQGSFRKDLYYRLGVFPIEVPPLRDHREDIPLLAAHFVENAARRFNCPDVHLTERNILELQEYDWPGNVRELQNAIERAVIVSRCGALKLDLSINRPVDRSIRRANTETGVTAFLTNAEWKRRERDNLVAALRAANWKIYGRDGAAELLGIKPTTLASRMRAFGLTLSRSLKNG